MKPRYAELQVTSHFSFLRGASSCAELFAQASALGMEALAVVDRNSLAGVVQAFKASRELPADSPKVRLVVGCRLDLVDGMSLLVYPTDRAAYGRLCRLLTIGKKRAGKGKCHLDWADVMEWNEGLLAVLDPDAVVRIDGAARMAGGAADAAPTTRELRGAATWATQFIALSRTTSEWASPALIGSSMMMYWPPQPVRVPPTAVDRR